MEDKSVSEIQQLIGLPEYALHHHHASDRNPLEAWVPPPGRQTFSGNDLYNLFGQECTAFAGDSTARRAADTLHYMIEHRNDPSSTHFNFLYNWTRVQGYHTRVIGGGDPSLESGQFYKVNCEPGTVDNIWKPLFRQLKTFKYDKKHSVILIGAGAWDLKLRNQLSPKEIEQKINATIHKLHESIPPSVLILWKSAGFSRNSQWGYLEPNETVKVGQQGVNYLVYHANMVAKREIQRINSRRVIFLDWAKEVFPHMYNRNTFKLMLAENHDTNPWHSGPIPRGLLIQMMAWEIHSWKSLEEGSFSLDKNAMANIATSTVPILPHYDLNKTESWRWKELLNQALSKSTARGSFMHAVGGVLLLLIGSVRIIRLRKRRS